MTQHEEHIQVSVHRLAIKGMRSDEIPSSRRTLPLLALFSMGGMYFGLKQRAISMKVRQTGGKDGTYAVETHRSGMLGLRSLSDALGSPSTYRRGHLTFVLRLDNGSSNDVMSGVITANGRWDWVAGFLAGL